MFTYFLSGSHGSELGSWSRKLWIYSRRTLNPSFPLWTVLSRPAFRPASSLRLNSNRASYCLCSAKSYHANPANLCSMKGRVHVKYSSRFRTNRHTNITGFMYARWAKCTYCLFQFIIFTDMLGWWCHIINSDKTTCWTNFNLIVRLTKSFYFEQNGDSS